MKHPKTRADVGMVQCVSEGHGKPPGRKIIGTRMVQMYSKSANVNDLGFAWTGWSSCLHGPALLLVPRIFLPDGLPCPSETH